MLFLFPQGMDGIPTKLTSQPKQDWGGRLATFVMCWEQWTCRQLGSLQLPFESLLFDACFSLTCQMAMVLEAICYPTNNNLVG